MWYKSIMRDALAYGVMGLCLGLAACGDDEETGTNPGGTGAAGGAPADCSSFELADTKAIAALAYANDMVEEAVTRCASLATALGATPPSASQPPTSDEVNAICAEAAGALEEALADGATRVGIVIPTCEPDAGSQATCEAQCPGCKVCVLDAALDATCAPPATVTVVSPDLALVDALEADLPALIELQARSEALVPAIATAAQMVTDQAESLPEECSDPITDYGKNLGDAGESVTAAASVTQVVAALP